MLPTKFPPWEMVYQQTQRWLNAGCFEAMISDLRSVQGQPSTVNLIVDRACHDKALCHAPHTAAKATNQPPPGNAGVVASEDLRISVSSTSSSWYL